MIRTPKFLALFVLLASCAADPQPSNPPSPAENVVLDDRFGDYWYQGEAEITSYDLSQARYGQLRDGDAVLIFVTEDFSKEKQVKLDDWQSVPPEERSTVLKLNATRKFVTGIYPYSMMSSIFTPVQLGPEPATVKVTTSSQEWCGHTFVQLNKRANGYKLLQRSYFESEGDLDETLDGVMLEDEIWTRIRLSPSSLPAGEFRIIPGTIYQRFSHDPLRPVAVNGSISSDDSTSVYTLEYPSLERTLAIQFETEFPHRILGWEESRYSGFGANREKMKTTATRRASLKTPYWSQNSKEDEHLRAELGLE